jgi:hypothetical protein
MSRRALTDEEKKARGTFEERDSEVNRTKRHLATVHAFPTFREIPEPTVPLGEAGRRAYDKWARILFDAGHLTEISQGFIQIVGQYEDASAYYHERGKPLPTQWVQIHKAALGELKYLNADKSLAPKQEKSNPFARNGFARRLR